MVYTLRFFAKCSFFYNSNIFGSCVIHILYTVCAKIKKNNSGAKKLIFEQSQECSAALCSLDYCKTTGLKNLCYLLRLCIWATHGKKRDLSETLYEGGHCNLLFR